MAGRFRAGRFWVAVGVLAVLTASAVMVVQRWHRLFPSNEVSEV